MRELSNNTGITTTDIRLLLLLDDWKSTISNIVKKGSEAFKDIIPYGQQINALIKEIIPDIPPVISKPVRYSVATLVSAYL